METGFTERYQGTSAPCAASPVRDFEPVGQVLLDADKTAHEALAMARQLADILGGPIPSEQNGKTPKVDDLRNCLIDHRCTVFQIRDELQRALRNLKG